MRAVELRVLHAAKACTERWGLDRLTIDDIAHASGVSRATIYRLFPGGKDVLFEALRVHELEEFFGELEREVVDAASLDDLIVRTVVTATQLLRADPGEALSQFTVDGVPRIIRFADELLLPRVAAYLPRADALTLIDVLSRLTISYFLAPSDVVDLGDPDSARRFLAPLVAVFGRERRHQARLQPSQGALP